MTTKSTFSALGAPMSLAWVHESPRRGTGIANVRRKRRSRPQHKVIAPLAETRRGALQGMGIFAHSSPDPNRPN
jgi:hypothetical protein